MDGILGEMKLIVDKRQQMYDHRTMNNIGDLKMTTYNLESGFVVERKPVKHWTEYVAGDQVYVTCPLDLSVHIQHEVTGVFATVGKDGTEEVFIEVKDDTGDVFKMPLDRIVDMNAPLKFYNIYIQGEYNINSAPTSHFCEEDQKRDTENKGYLIFPRRPTFWRKWEKSKTIPIA